MPVLGGYSILVEWGTSVGVFSRVAGIRGENAVLDQTVATVRGPTVQKIPGRYNCYPVTFMAGYMEDLVAGHWWQSLTKIQSGDIESTRGTCTITFFDTNKAPVLHIELQDAWPSKWSAADMSVQRSILWIETIVFQCERIVFHWV